MVYQVKSAIAWLKAERRKLVRLLKGVNESSAEGIKDFEEDLEEVTESLSYEFEMISKNSEDWLKK